MSSADLLSVLSGAVVGLMLGLVGGGGSILATPALLYIVGVADAHVAIGTSAVAVSVNAFMNLGRHAARGNVKWPCALAFAGAGIAGAAGGAALGRLTDARILLPLFALLMIAIGARMLHTGGNGGDINVHLSWSNAPKIVGAGFIVGALSGFFGIGGGFLIVPGLMAASGMPMLSAVGSSLFVVGAFGATTATSYAVAGLVDWRIAALFIAGGFAGGLAGVTLGPRLAQRKGVLQSVFAVIVIAVGLYMLWSNGAAALARLAHP